MEPPLRRPAGRATRRALRRLPRSANVIGRVRRVLPDAHPSAVGRLLADLAGASGRSRRAAPVPRDIEIAGDVADSVALRTLLSDTDIFEGSEEADAYLADALQRFQVTMSLLPPLGPGAQVLELGANPYFLTRLLRRRGIEVTCANWFGEQAGLAAQASQVVTSPTSGLSEEFRFEHFNVETSAFPYPDGTFDLVLCCEILEHLPNDPIHLLAEIHRVVAKPRGQLLLTTPNATRADNLVRMLEGVNVYEELSGHGVYGRHNREYTVAELRTLLSECGYVDAEVLAVDVHPPPENWQRSSAGACLEDRGDNLFALARPIGEPRWSYPRWLFSSRHVLRRVVRPDLVMGINDDLQAWDLHPLEEMPEGFGRWTGAGRASALLSTATEGIHALTIEGKAPPAPAGPPLALHVEIDEAISSWDVVCDGRTFRLSADVTVREGDQRVSLWTDRTWVPGAVGLGNDDRQLGVVLQKMSLVKP